MPAERVSIQTKTPGVPSSSRRVSERFRAPQSSSRWMSGAASCVSDMVDRPFPGVSFVLLRSKLETMGIEGGGRVFMGVEVQQSSGKSSCCWPV